MRLFSQHMWWGYCENQIWLFSLALGVGQEMGLESVQDPLASADVVPRGMRESLSAHGDLPLPASCSLQH